MRWTDLAYRQRRVVIRVCYDSFGRVTPHLRGGQYTADGIPVPDASNTRSGILGAILRFLVSIQLSPLTNPSNVRLVALYVLELAGGWI